jgi:hypothetical protein
MQDQDFGFRQCTQDYQDFQDSLKRKGDKLLLERLHKAIGDSMILENGHKAEPAVKEDPDVIYI